MTLQRLRLRNARSHADTALDFHPGVNVIVGESDSGKSNIVRALRALVYNESAKSFVRDGQSTAMIRAKFSDASVVMVKGDRENSYRVGTQHFTKVGLSRVDAVLAATNLGPREYGDEAVDINFAMQRDPAFGVDTKPALLARIVGSVCGIDRVLRATQAATSDTNRISATVKSLVAESEYAQTSLHSFDLRYDLDAIGKRIDAVRAELARADTFAAKARTVADQAAAIRAAATHPALRIDPVAAREAIATYDAAVARANRIDEKANAIAAQAKAIRDAERRLATIPKPTEKPRVCPTCRRPL